LALGVEPAEPNIMNQKPRDTKEGILHKGMYGGIIFQAIAIAGACLLAYYLGVQKYGLTNGLEKIRTIVFTTMITAELLRAFSSRSEDYTLFKIGFFSNKAMNRAVLVSFALTLIVLYIPALNGVFHTVPLSLADWQNVLLLSFIPLIMGETYKKIFKNK